MSSRIPIVAIIFILYFVLDIYAWSGLRHVFSQGKFYMLFQIVYGLISVVTIIGFIYTMISFQNPENTRSLASNFLLGFAFSVLIFKILISAVFLLEDIVRLLKYLSQFIWDLVGTGSEEGARFPGRRKFVGQLGLIIAGVPFAGMLYGITRGKYSFTLHELTLNFPDLPDAFDGFKLVQISDVHSGSFDSSFGVEKGVEMIQEQNPDAIVFTGDLVNNVSSEIEPWINTFGQLSAPHGMYSILGNHDYGDYVRWPSRDEKALNLEKLKQHHRDIGFKLLLNEHVKLEKEGQHINIIGVENWGLPPFPQHGDLNRALEGASSEGFNILLSHDPSHWDAQILDHPTHFHLTLSGHTHGMQFGVEIPGFRWSPVKYRYPRWAGLYEEAKQFLYVNRGFGFLGFPGRVGIWPEVTAITFKKG